MISIATKLRPFSHSRGAKCLIPGTDVVIEAFPHLLRLGSLEIPLDNDPFLPGFTLQQDLERNCVWVFGKAFRVKITATPEGFTVASSGVTKFYPAVHQFHVPKEIETLSLGSNKAQDWDLVVRRMDCQEILPVLYHLGQKTVPSKKTLPLITSYEEFYRASFHQIAVPRENVLRETFEKIRSQFIVENGTQITLLPDNPFPHGRLLNVQAEYGSFDLEWTKRKLRRASFLPKKTGELFLFKIFRKKTDLHEKGTVVKKESPLSIEEGKRVYLDQFFE